MPSVLQYMLTEECDLCSLCLFSIIAAIDAQTVVLLSTRITLYISLIANAVTDSYAFLDICGR
jgi:hypothetical protein